MALENDAKFKEKLTCSFKYHTRNLVNFHPTPQKFENVFSMGSFCPKYTRFELQKYRGVIFYDTEQWCKVWINPDLVISKMTWRIGWTFISASKVWKLYFDVLFLSKAYNVSARKFYRNYESWHGNAMKDDAKFRGKLTLGLINDIRNLRIGIFIRAVISLKICTLIGSFCPKHIKF